MKALIVSDIHGNYLNMKKVIDDNKEFDYLILLGDILTGNGYKVEELINLLNSYNTKIICVRGNCDIDSKLIDFSLDNDYIITAIDHKIFYLTHGHLYNKDSFPNLDYDVYIQGHTHVAMMDEDNNKLYLNPGSISLPRNGVKSYIYYEDGEFQLKSVDEGKVIKKM